MDKQMKISDLEEVKPTPDSLVFYQTGSEQVGSYSLSDVAETVKNLALQKIGSIHTASINTEPQTANSPYWITYSLNGERCEERGSKQFILTKYNMYNERLDFKEIYTNVFGDNVKASNL